MRVAWYVPISFADYLALTRVERELLIEALQEMKDDMGDGEEPPPRRVR